MNFQTIELDTWYRKSYFDHYMKEAKCSFSITANVNVTNLLAVLKKNKLYPAFIYIVSRVIHSRPEFRTTFDDKGQLGYWEQMHPCYAIFFIRTTKRFPPSGRNTQTIFAVLSSISSGRRALWRQKGPLG